MKTADILNLTAFENISSKRNNIASSTKGNSMSFSIENLSKMAQNFGSHAHFRSKSHDHKKYKNNNFFCENSSEFLNIFFSKNLSKIAIFYKKLKIFFSTFLFDNAIFGTLVTGKSSEQ